MQKDIKDRLSKRKIAYVYLLHRMFDGNPTAMARVIGAGGVYAEDIAEWDVEYRDAVYQTIQQEDLNGVTLKDKEDVPSIKSIKEKVLRRCNDLINETTDPAKLATVYKTLSEFEVTDEKKTESVLDAINNSVKDLRPAIRKKKTVTILDKLGVEKPAPAPEAPAEDEDEDFDEDELEMGE